MNGSCSLNVSREIYCNKERDKFLCVEPYLPELQIAVMLLTAVMSCTFNVLLILAAVRTKTTSANVRILTITLAVAYGFVAGFILPIRGISVFYSKMVLPRVFCLINPVITMFAFTLSQSSMLAISIDRYVAIHYPLKYPMLVTNGKVVFLLSLMGILSLVASIPQFFNIEEVCFRPRSIPICIFYWEKSITKTLIVISTIIVVPNIFILCAYLEISLLAKRHKQLIEIQKQVVLVSSAQNRRGAEKSDLDSSCTKHQGQNNTETLQRNRQSFVTGKCRDMLNELKTQKIVLLSAGSMVVCWTPYISTIFWYLFSEDTAIPYSVEFIAVLLVFFKCWITPLLILILNTHYRRFLTKLFVR